MLALLTDYTVQTVILGALLLGLTSGALGSFAVLRQQSLLGDALSHAALPGIALGFLVAGSRSLPALLAGALITAVAAALTITLLLRRSRLKSDAAIGISLSLYFAVGVVLLSYVQGSAGAGQAGLESFLFGQAAAMLRSDLVVMSVLALASLALLLALWKEFEVTSFDPVFAASIGLPVVLLDAVMTAMIALAVVLGLQMVGVVLMSAMIVAPAVAARQWTDRLDSMTILAALLAALSGVVGALISATARGLSTGPLIVLALTVITLVSLAFAPKRGWIASSLARRRARRNLHEHQVLDILQGLALRHDDAAYLSEEGMVDSALGVRARTTLQQLERQGLVERDSHRPEEGPHWRLTAEGREAQGNALHSGGKA